MKTRSLGAHSGSLNKTLVSRTRNLGASGDRAPVRQQPCSLLREINNHLPAVYKWLCSNKLTLNLTKTKFLIFMSRQKESFNLYPPLTVANVYLEKSFCVKYLGVYIDCHLTWHDHIDYTCGKISKNINIMAKLKHYVSKATLIIINIINSKILCTIVYLKFENQRKISKAFVLIIS